MSLSVLIRIRCWWWKEIDDLNPFNICTDSKWMLVVKGKRFFWRLLIMLRIVDNALYAPSHFYCAMIYVVLLQILRMFWVVVVLEVLFVVLIVVCNVFLLIVYCTLCCDVNCGCYCGLVCGAECGFGLLLSRFTLRNGIYSFRISWWRFFLVDGNVGVNVVLVVVLIVVLFAVCILVFTLVLLLVWIVLLLYVRRFARSLLLQW